MLQVFPKLFRVIAVICLLSATIYFVNYSSSSTDLIPFLSLLGIILIRLIPSFNNMSTALSLVKYHSVSHKLLLKEFKNLVNQETKQILKNNFNTNVFKKGCFLII